MPTSAVQTSKPGFTLIEILVALVVLAVLSVTVSMILQGGLRAWTLQEADALRLQQREAALVQSFAGQLDAPAIAELPEASE